MLKIFNKKNAVSLPELAGARTVHLYDVNGQEEFADFWNEKKTIRVNGKSLKYGLHTALQRYTKPLRTMDSRIKRTRTQRFCFTDILIRLPIGLGMDMNDGELSYLDALMLDLRHFYQTKIPQQQRLHARKSPRFKAIYDASLAENEMIIQFGDGIYVASNEERAESRVLLQGRDSLGRTFSYPAVVSFNCDANDDFDLVYPDQKNLYLCPSIERGVNEQAQWFSEAIKHLWLQRVGEGPWKVGLSSAQRNCLNIEQRTEGDRFIFHCIDTSLVAKKGQEPYLEVVISPVDSEEGVFEPESSNASEIHSDGEQYHSVEPEEASVWSESCIVSEASSVCFGDSVIPEMKGIPLSIWGLALPQSQRWPDLLQWRICIDRNGLIVKDSRGMDTSQFLVISDDRQNGMGWSCDGRAGQLIAGQTVDFFGRELDVIAAPRETPYMAFLVLPQPVDVLLDFDSPVVAGWDLGGDVRPDINIGLLMDPEGTTWAPGSKYQGARMSQLGLSRQSFWLQEDDDSVLLKLHEKSRADVWLLDSELQVQQHLSPKDADEQVRLEQGASILAGCMLMRLE